jgi:Na+-transporting methylmalonyl-CoA/oxaloacetate decarboxylase gamma subunit
MGLVFADNAFLPVFISLLGQVISRFGRPRRVIGSAFDEHMHTDLVQAALVMAVALRTNLVRSVGRAAVDELGRPGGALF